MTRFAGRAALALLLMGCGTLDPEIGAAPAGDPPPTGCDIIDSDPDETLTFDMIRDVVFRPQCSCHVEAGGIGRSEGGLDLDDYDALMAGGRNSAATAVVAGDPCASILVQKLGNAPPFGARMPFRSFALPDDAHQMITDWIADGAPR